MADKGIELRVIVEHIDMILLDKKQITKALRAAGQEIAALARLEIRTATGDGRTYYNSGGNKYHDYIRKRYVASSPGNAPVNLTGNLAKKISANVKGLTVEVKDSAFYSAALAIGANGGGPLWDRKRARAGLKQQPGVKTRRLEPRPWLDTALAEREDSISARLKEAFERGMTFQKMAVQKP